MTSCLFNGPSGVIAAAGSTGYLLTFVCAVGLEVVVAHDGALDDVNGVVWHPVEQPRQPTTHECLEDRQLLHTYIQQNEREINEWVVSARG